jgi:hypothetical protein
LEVDREAKEWYIGVKKPLIAQAVATQWRFKVAPQKSPFLLVFPSFENAVKPLFRSIQG